MKNIVNSTRKEEKVSFICMSEMALISVGHMSGAVRLNHVCTQPRSRVIFWARRRIEDAKKEKKKEDEET